MAQSEWVDIRVRLSDARKFQADANATAASVRRIGHAADSQAASMSRATRRSFAYQQALFTVRRGIYAATLALTAASAATVSYGLQFNMTMEDNRMALSHFLGGVGAANRELDFLYNLAAKTPFEFQDLTVSARKFLAFGFTVQETNDYLTILGDTIAGLALGVEGVGRATLAIGQIQAKGRVMGEELLQLTELGIPALQILQRELGLTAQQVGRIGELAIPASVAIPALMRGMQKEFGGMAEEQSKTMRGQLSSLRDYARQLAGSLTFPLFEALRTRLIPRAAEIVQAMQQAADPDRGGSISAAIRVLDEQVGAGGHIIEWWNRLAGAGRATSDIFRHAFIPALRTTYGVVSIFADLGLDPLIALLGFAADHTTLLRIAFTIWASWIAITRIRLIALYVIKKKNLVIDRITDIMMHRRVTAMKAEAFWINVIRIRLIAAAIATAAYTKASILAMRWGITPMILGLRILTATMITFLLTNPVGWAILFIGAVVALELKFKALTRFTKFYWDLLVRFKNWIMGNKISWDDFLPSGRGLLENFLKWNPATALPYRIATGVHGALSENEPRRARPVQRQEVRPINDLSAIAGGRPVPGIPPKLQIMLDGQELTQSTAKWIDDEEARR